MKNIIIIAAFSIFGFTANAEKAVSTTANDIKCNINVSGQTLVVANAQQQPVEVTIAKKSGEVLYQYNVKGYQKEISLKDLNEGKYNIVIKAPDGKEKTVLLQVL
ncbi:MAG: hypothetical protein JST82_01040 [Bacteroidetes bacterium]|nr:hypothetical protein [Bacteroidota bacterium]